MLSAWGVVSAMESCFCFLTDCSDRYICREWNKRHADDDRLKNLKFWYCVQDVYYNYTRGPWEKHLVHDHYCY
jgi:hypothetical protein